ncbi:MAG: hypothetical protein J0665_14500 [Deltaproteobacteria bacterium]|nr:hypothetical protein [Deltaproteobacteria bacterium]
MKCIDFETEIILALSPLQRAHIAMCPKCRLLWEEHALERAIINQPFDPEAEPDVDLADKPFSASWVTPEFERMLLEVKGPQATEQNIPLKKENVFKILLKFVEETISLISCSGAVIGHHQPLPLRGAAENNKQAAKPITIVNDFLTPPFSIEISFAPLIVLGETSIAISVYHNNLGIFLSGIKIVISGEQKYIIYTDHEGKTAFKLKGPAEYSVEIISSEGLINLEITIES